MAIDHQRPSAGRYHRKDIEGLRAFGLAGLSAQPPRLSECDTEFLDALLSTRQGEFIGMNRTRSKHQRMLGAHASADQRS